MWSFSSTSSSTLGIVSIFDFTHSNEYKVEASLGLLYIMFKPHLSFPYNFNKNFYIDQLGHTRYGGVSRPRTAMSSRPLTSILPKVPYKQQFQCMECERAWEAL